VARRVLFLVRGKLGDSLIAYATVRQYADSFPDDEVTLLIRSKYAQLLEGEKGVRILGFSNRLSLVGRLLRLALEPRFDALLAIWAFGKQVRWAGRLVRARRKVYLDRRFADLYPEYPDLPPEPLQSEPAWRVAQLFEPRLPQPGELRVAGLAAKKAARPVAIGIGPVSDEPRRTMGPEIVRLFAAKLRERHPGAPIRIFLNAADEGAKPLLEAGPPPGTELVFFPELADLVRELGQLAHLYTTDTGLHHVSAAMGVPTTVFYGPTQAWRNAMPRQPAFRRVRLKAIGTQHCEVKDCARPVCLEHAVARFCASDFQTRIEITPAACPLRDLPLDPLAAIEVHESPDRQAR
jgi:ADP-heptose:LPS heptosyltransferase